MSSTKPLRVIFAGTPDFAATALSALIHNQAQANIEVIAVYTQPDRPAGRGRQLKASPVKEVALKNNISIFQPDNFKSDDDKVTLKQLDADLMIVAAYGIILPLDVLQTPALGCINIHASILPRWRGAAPIQRAIIAGDTQTGITIMQMDEGLDTGDMLLTKECDIKNDDTGSSLHDKLAELGATAILQALDLIQTKTAQATAQDDTQACYAHKLKKEEAFINWQLSAEQIDRQIRAFNSWPVAQTHFDDKIIRIWQAKPISDETNKKYGEVIAVEKDSIIIACHQGSIAITELQLTGAKKMSVRDLLNGRPDLFQAGQMFT